MKPIENQKQTLRKAMIVSRNALSKADIQKKSTAIFKRLKTLDAYKHAKGVLIYSSFKSEVKTNHIILDLEQSGRSVFLPVLVDDKRFIACKKNDLNKKNKYGINEPYPIETADLKSGKIDLVICPGVAFDFNLNRLGHGKGYYDRFLKSSHAITKIGLAFQIQMVDDVFADGHDVPMDRVITEEKVYRKNDKG